MCVSILTSQYMSTHTVVFSQKNRSNPTECIQSTIVVQLCICLCPWKNPGVGICVLFGQYLSVPFEVTHAPQPTR